MRWRLRPKPKRVPGEYPERFVKAWMATTLPTTTPAEASAAVAHLRGKGWTEEQVAEFILPYMPRGARGAATPEGGGAASAASAAPLDAGVIATAPGEQPVVPPPGEPPVVPPAGDHPVAPAAGEPPAAPAAGEPLVAAPPGAPSAALPPDVTRSWLDAHLPQLDRRQLRLVVDELERQGWPPGAVAMTVLPHLLPTLSAADARAIVAGLAELGMTDAEIARATAPP